MIELLSTKLFIPRPRKNLVSRPRLVDRLNIGLDKKLTLIAAPAGYGKTTLLSEWIPQSPRCVTWLSLDEGDNDPTKFWAYFISSLQRLHSDLGTSASTLLQSPQAPSITSILTALINDITTFPDSFVFVLDDFHVIDFPPIHEALTFLIDHLPSNMHLVMTSRIDPPLSLARLRAGDELTELRAVELRFTAEETAAFLNQVMELNLSAEEVITLETRTDGWIAGLQIAALSMQGHNDVVGFIRAFSGSHRHILGYLAEEVLNQQPQGTLNFLLQTSILDRLCGPLCDAVTGESGGQETLETLEHTNLFITPLDNVGQWYRYHPLFAEVLQVRLQQNYRDEVPELHRRAANWHARQGMVSEALPHALAGADFEKAAHLIENVAGTLLRRGSSSSLIHWLDAMPEEEIRSRPRLCLARGWAYVWGSAFRLEKAEEWAQFALQVAKENGSLDSALSGEVYALEALIAADKVDLPLSQDLASRALEHLPADSPWRGVTTFCLGSALYAAGNFSVASPTLTEALRLSQADGALYTQLIAASFLGDIQAFQGHLGRAKVMYQQVLAWSDPGIPQKGALVAHAGLANVLCEQDQLDESLVQVESGVEQLEQVGGPGAALWLYRILARVQQAKGNWTEALVALERAYKSGQSAQIPFVMTQVGALRASLQLAQGDLRTATAWAANSGLAPDDPATSHPGLREVEYLSFARVLNAQGRHGEALSLLDQLLQAAEAEERFGSVIGILVLQCLVVRKQGNTTHPLTLLERALTLAEPEDYLRTFIDEGEPMRLLLLDYQSTIKMKISDGGDGESLRLLTYTDKLLAAFSQPAPIEKPKYETIPETLSERERDILRLIAAGNSNLEIAEQMVLAQSTVKWYINSLYSKLGARSRTHALALARELELI